jgi:hypothetical protein
MTENPVVPQTNGRLFSKQIFSKSSRVLGEEKSMTADTFFKEMSCPFKFAIVI